MDRAYLDTTIQLLESQRAGHDSAFAGNAAHAGCLERFDRVISALRQRLAELQAASPPERADCSEAAFPLDPGIRQ